MALFEKRSTKEKNSHFRNLVAVALADGKLDPNETKYLSQLALKWGISPQEVQAILAKPTDIKFVAPKDNQTRIDQMFEIVGMMMIDGNIHGTEVQLCQAMASKLGFPTNVVATLVAKIVEAVSGKIAMAQARTNISTLLA